MNGIFNIEIKDSQNVSSSVLSEITNNTLGNVVFSSTMLEKVKGTCLNKKRI